MTCKEFLEKAASLAPFEYAEGWDNCGLLLGNLDKEIHCVYIAVDATEQVIEDAVEGGADLLLTHHPLIFSPLKRIVSDDFIGARLIRLLQQDICLVAMHTNFDIMGMADAAADEMNLQDRDVLEVTFEDDVAKAGFGRIGRLSEPMSLEDLGEYVKRVFHVPTVRIYGAPDREIRHAAILPGSGKSFVDAAIAGGADVLITGDISHHEGIDAVARNLCIIDAGHYGIEKLFVSYMEQFLHREMREIEILTEPTREPFWVI